MREQTKGLRLNQWDETFPWSLKPRVNQQVHCHLERARKKKGKAVKEAKVDHQMVNKYLLLSKFEGRTVSYGPSFSPINLWPLNKACGPQIDGEKQGSATYSTDQENKASKIFFISLLCVWQVWEWLQFTQNSFKFLMHLERKTGQFEIVVMHNFKRKRKF